MFPTTESNKTAMEQHKHFIRLKKALVIIALVLSGVGGYLLIASIQEAQEKLQFIQLETGAYKSIQDAILETQKLSDQIAENLSSGIADEKKVNRFSSLLLNGLTKEPSLIVKLTYLETFLDAKLAYQRADEKSEAFENLIEEASKITRANNEEWKTNLREMDSRIGAALEQSLEIKVTNKIIKIATFGMYDPQASMDSAEEHIKESLKKARKTIETAVTLQG
ncbi:hypothetical protein CL689_02935 [Candidatus Saccharibacteria bacterium]|nr:hypothetical protein [Candidatus Saccharibacteria bacterium]|tara:strand:- start:3222 stop:3890 length:669 start_codon:yes stop_codon:yes gene_type:complete